MVPAGKKYQDSAFALAGISCASKPGMRNTAKKILIVDDNDACRESLGGFIRGLGYEVFEATTGLEAIDRASSTTSRSHHDGSDAYLE